MSFTGSSLYDAQHGVLSMTEGGHGANECCRRDPRLKAAIRVREVHENLCGTVHRRRIDDWKTCKIKSTFVPIGVYKDLLSNLEYTTESAVSGIDVVSTQMQDLRATYQ